MFEFRVLGPLDVVRDGERLRFRGGRERALLALLVLNANQVVSSERLSDDLWGGDPPEGAVRTLRVYVSRVRQTLGDPGDVVVTCPSGYLLQVNPDSIDAARFDALVAAGRDQAKRGDHARAAVTLREALALWRGAALADVADAPFARAEATRLEDARLAALEDRLDADLACGRHAELAGELEGLTGAHPFRERLWAQRIVALYRAGRQADAVRAYQRLRDTLGAQLGLEPSEALRRLEGAVLRHSPELDWPPPPAVPVASAPASPAGVVTLLFTDVVGSTELLGQLGEDAAEQSRQGHFRLLREAVAAHGGREVKSLGDGLMVAFSSALGALACAVDMQQTVRRAGRGQARSVQIRVGVHAGQPMRDQDDYYGTPVVVAKRLCDRAEAGQILASSVLCDLVGRRGDHGVAFRSLGGLLLKGLGEPVAACEVVWRPEPAAAPIAGAGPGSLPLPLGREEQHAMVGREAELARLEAAWEATRSGERRLVLVGGEPGIGKSRLTSDFARRVHRGGGLVLFGRCDEGMGVPYQPVVEALGRYLKDAPAPALGPLAGELVRLVPEVAERVPGLPLPLRSDPETERYRLFEATAGWLAAMTEQAPVMFALDDMHWATKPTLLLLSHLVRSEERLQLLLVATYRDNAPDMSADLADAVATLFRHPGVERLGLSGLDHNGVAALMETRAGHGLDDEGWALAGIVHTETAGNPFFVREVLRHLTEKGAVVREGGRWVAGQPVTDIDVPDSVREVVGRRLTRLPDKTEAVLSVAAVLGERFEFRVLAQAVGEGEPAVLEALDPAVAARLVEEDAVGSYRFAHALVRSTLEEALGPTRRAQLHLGAAAAIESTYTGRLEGRAAVLAAHYVRAGALAPPARVVDALIDAGREAAAAAAWEQVAAHWRHALHLMDQGGGGDDRRADLLARLADLLHMTGFDLVGSLTHLEEAIALFAEAGDEKRVAVLRSRLGGYLASNPVYGVMDVTRGLREFEAAERVLEAQPDSLAYGYQQATLAGATGMWAFRPLEGLTRSQRAMQIAEHLGHDSLWVIGAMTHGYALVAVGHIEKGLPLLERAWETADRLDQGPYLGMRAAQLRAFWGALLFEPLVTVTFSERELSKPRLAHVPIQRQLLQGTLARGYVLAGRLPEAERVLDEAGEVPPGVTSGPPLTLWQGDWAVAEAALLHSRDRFREMGSRIDEAILDEWTAEARRLQGNTSGAEKILREALDIALAAGADAFEAGFRIDLCLLGVEQGQVHSARQHLDRARELMSGDDWRGLGGRLAVAEAAMLGADGDLTAAANRFEAALAVLRHHCLPWEEAEALLRWGRACAVGGAGAEAAEHFDAALAVYDRIAAAGPWRERVERARATLL